MANGNHSSDWIKRTIDIITVVILGGGLWYAKDQAEKFQTNLNASTWNNIGTQLLTVDKLFVESPDMVKYFYSGTDINPGDTDYEKAAAIATYHLDFFDNFSGSVKQMDRDFFDVEAYEEYFRTMFTKSPILCRILERDLLQYGGGLVKIGMDTCHWTSKGPVGTDRP